MVFSCQPKQTLEDYLIFGDVDFIVIIIVLVLKPSQTGVYGIF